MSKLSPIEKIYVPSSDSAEKGCLSSILQEPSKCLEKCLEIGVEKEWFFSPARSLIYQSILEMREAGKSIDPATITQFLDDRERLADIGDASTIAELFTFTSGWKNIGHYLEIMREKFIARTALGETQALLSSFHSDKGMSVQAVSDLITGAFKETKELCSKEGEQPIDHKADVMSFVDEMDKIAKGEMKRDRFTTSLPTLDKIMNGGGKREQLIVVHGNTSSGKSLLMSAILKENALQNSRRGVIYSFEMMHKQCIQRMVSQHGEISMRSMEDGRYNQGEFNRFMRASLEIANAPLTVYDINRCKPTPQAIEVSIRRLCRKNPLDIVAIDYLGLLKFKSKQEKRKDQELQEFSSSLKLLAQELGLMVVLLAQANKEGSVFDASQVESDADLVINIIPLLKKINGVNKIVGAQSIFVQKHREGKRGDIIPITLDGEYSRIIEREAA